MNGRGNEKAVKGAGHGRANRVASLTTDGAQVSTTGNAANVVKAFAVAGYGKEKIENEGEA